MSQAAAGVVALGSATGEDLCLASQAAKSFCVQDAANVARVGGAVKVSWLGVSASGKQTAGIVGDSDVWWKRLCRICEAMVFHG